MTNGEKLAFCSAFLGLAILATNLSPWAGWVFLAIGMLLFAV